MAIALFLLTPPVSAAGTVDGGLRVEVIAAYNLVVDSNVESPSTYAPRAAYLGAKIWNDGTNLLTNVVARIGDYAAGTPGLYPTNQHPAYPTIVGPLTNGMFALTHEGGAAGVADATRYVGQIAPGNYASVYWLISYPNLDKSGQAVWGPSVKPDDDLKLYYDVWATAAEDGSPREAVETRSVTMRNEISAMANKILPNTANKVPQEYQDLLGKYFPAWDTAAADGSPGSRIVAEGVWYDLGNVGQGFDNDGDLVPDQNAWMQPVGDASIFDASCFRLVHTYALVIVKLKTGGEEILYAEDELYFENIPPNNGAVGWVGYEFVPMRGNCSSALSPYQEVASGFDNEKFNGDYGASLGIPMESIDPSVKLLKTADGLATFPGDTLWYNLTYSPARETLAGGGLLLLGDPGLGLPVVLKDSIPDGTTYVKGSASISNDLPDGVTGYQVLYSTNNAVSWQLSEPSTGSAVTDLQWWLDDPLAGGTTGIFRFAVLVDSPFLEPLPEVSNTACQSFGDNGCDTNSIIRTPVLGTNVLGDLVFRDIGAGAFYGNGTNDAGEAGISNITVKVYYDANSNDVVDAADMLFDTTTTATNGWYLFDTLPDGSYVVVVDTADPDMPYGYSPTTPITYAIDLDPTHLTSNRVTDLTADFGFAPVLALDKSVIGSTNVYEGGQVTFQITVTNQFVGDGTGIAGSLVVTNWATARDTSKDGGTGWGTTQTNALGAPDDSDAVVVITSNGDDMGVTGFSGGNQGSITNAQLIIPLSSIADPDDFYFRVYLWTNGASAGQLVAQYTMATIPVDETVVLDVTTNFTTLTWASISNTTIQLAGAKNKGNGGYEIHVDAVGFRLETDGSSGAATGSNTLYPVPLHDTYDADLLRYVSSTPAASSTVTNGTAPDKVGLLTWDNIGPIYPGGTSTVFVTFDVVEPPGNQSTIVTNIAYVNSATFSNGIPANTATDEVAVVIVPTAVLGDYVWRDLNGDGVQDTNEVGIGNVQVVLQPPAGVDAGNGPGNAVTNTTDSQGLYLFGGLIATNYTVSVLTNSLPGGAGVNTGDPDGTNDSTTVASITNAPGGGPVDNLDVDFGYQVTATIEGIVWNDANRSGTFPPDSGEPRFDNVTVTLYSNLTAIATTNTDATGYYQFLGVASGTYTVVVSTNTGDMAGTGWTPSYDTDGTGTVNTATVSVVAGGSARADFGYYELGAYDIGDTLFYDWNGNGSQEGNEEGIPDITVTLYADVNSNGVLDVGTDLPVASQSTATNGTYLFAGWPTGAYLVVVNVNDPDFPANVTCTADPDATKDGRSAVNLTATDLDQDFGWQPAGTGAIGDTVWKDINGDGAQAGPAETGVSGIEVYLYVDLNGDGSYSLIATNTTDAQGEYLFSDLPDADYRVAVDIASTNIPSDAFDVAYAPSTVTSHNVTISGGNTYLDADFGFAPLGAIGDTIFWDMNSSGSQDAFEPGVTNVTVQLYRDVNTNGLYESGTDTLVTNTVTTTNGFYLFRGLTNDDYVVVVVTNAGPLAGTTLMADPDADGLPCTDPSVTNGCDSAYGVTTTYGTAFMGADFGYLPPGVIGDTVWFDMNTNGVRDAGEYGIPYIEVLLYTNGTLVATNTTDADGYYTFGNLADGTYRVVVNTNDTDWPAGVIQVYDPDGTSDNQASLIVITNQHISTISGITYTNDMDVDFGYRYDGSNVLSGTVGLDGVPLDGALGDGAISGVASNEAAFSNVTVYVYLWQDDGDTNVTTSETILIASTVTDGNGDYQFTGLPQGGAVSNYYIVSLAAPYDDLLLTTTNESTPALWITPTTNYDGTARSAYQVIDIAPVVTNIDFAFTLASAYDFGDLPDTYGTSLQASPQGARHKVAATPNLFLGMGVDAEPNGQPTSDATGDDLDVDGDDEDGVVTSGYWQSGTNGGLVSVAVGAGSGWLVGWIDFDGSGTFTGSGEMIANQAVSNSGSPYSIAFDIPSGAISATTTTVLNARFRLFPSQPSLPQTAFSGIANNGEVEDYQWTLGVIGDAVWVDLDRDGIQDAGEPPLAGVTVYLDLDMDGVRDAGEPYATTDANGLYSIGGLGEGAYRAAVDTSTLPAGVQPTYDLDGGLDNRAVASITNGQVRLDVDFGYAGESSIGDRIWLDEDSDGVQDAGEAGIPNVTVRLYEAGADDTLGTGDDVLIAVTVTDAQGGYIFTGLPTGDYRVVVDTSTMDSTLAAHPTYDPDGGLNHYADESITDPIEIDTVDFGYNWAPTPNVNNNTGTGAIGDRVWVDADGDGAQDPGEPGVEGVAVVLYVDADTNGTYETAIATNVTDVNGLYIFTNLTAGAYVVEVASTNFAAGGPLNGDTQTGDPDEFGQPASVADNKTTTPILLTPGDVFVNADFGYQPASVATIGDQVYVDVNADGTNNPADGDYPIEGVTISLYDTNGNVIATTVTDANGSNYLFSVAEAGTYVVRITDTRHVLGGMLQTDDPDGIMDREHTLTVALGNSYLDVDFGFTAYGQEDTTGLIGDLVFLDRNANDVADPGEALEGIVVGLYDASGSNLLATTSTDENGHYYFGGLGAGTYVVRVDTNSLPGGAAGLANNVDPDGGADSESSVTLAAGEINLDQDFGYSAAVPNTISGTIWEDRDADGTLEGAETNRFGGVTVALLDTNRNVLAVTTTDVNGDFSFEGLPDSTYDVDVLDLDGVLFGTWHSDGPNAGSNNNSQVDAYRVAVAGGTTNDTADFGYFLDGAAVGNFVWNDDSAWNGSQDSGETGIVSHPVILTIDYASEADITVAVITDGSGHYRFGNLLLDEDGDSGIYSLSTPTPSGMYPTYIGATNSWLDSNDPGGTVFVASRGVTDVSADSYADTNDNTAATFDFGFASSPTLVVLISFGAESRTGDVYVVWETAAELGTIGFFVERRDEVTGLYAPVHSAIVPGSLFAVGETAYEVRDPGAVPGGTYTYRLIEIENTGNQNTYGPFTVTVDGGSADLVAWLEQWFGDLSLSNVVELAEADPDGDGMSNFEEFLARTNPDDILSALRLVLAEMGQEGLTIEWTSVTGCLYDVEFSTNLLQGFECVIENIEATPPANSVTVPAPKDTAVFYRIKLSQ